MVAAQVAGPSPPKEITLSLAKEPRSGGRQNRQPRRSSSGNSRGPLRGRRRCSVAEFATDRTEDLREPLVIGHREWWAEKRSNVVVEMLDVRAARPHAGDS